MFRVGDYIIGNDKSKYTITSVYTLCKILQMDIDGRLFVEVIRPIEGDRYRHATTGIYTDNNWTGTTYWVNSEDFKLIKRSKSHLPGWW